MSNNFLIIFIILCDDVLLKLFLTNLIDDQQDLDTYCCHVPSPYVGPDKKIIKSFQVK